MTPFEITLLGLLRFVLLSAGITYYLTQSFIFAPIRVALTHHLPEWALGLRYFVYCPACVGSWVGLALWFSGAWPLGGAHAWVYAIVASCVVNRLMPTDTPGDFYMIEAPNDETKEG